MESVHYDNYTDYSDSSAPRTPSPVMQFDDQPLKHHQQLDNWHSQPYLFNNNSRGSLLQELYAEDQQPSYNDQWQQAHHHQQQQHHQHQQQQHHHHHQQQLQQRDFQMMRRATFPYVRHDRDDQIQQSYPPFMQHHYQSMDHPVDQFIPSISSSPHSTYADFDDPTSIKLEDPSPVNIMVPSQQFYRPNSANNNNNQMGMAYLSPHTGLPVQHTDDAASKETQYLRRRCFNCHTTEPPSWRRSTLNPGKIVCNKCGLYERTHLRPRPLRFDELRAGNKVRGKQSKGAISPKAKTTPAPGIVKKEPREYSSLMRRGSVSSGSSVHSGSGASDWDDNVSIYSAGSAPPTSYSSPNGSSYNSPNVTVFNLPNTSSHNLTTMHLNGSQYNSPNISTFPLGRDSASASPPHDGGIRLPNAPLSDIAMQQQQQQQQAHTQPRKSHSTPGYFSPGQITASLSGGSPPADYFVPRQEWGPEDEGVVGLGMTGGSPMGVPMMPSPLPVVS